MISVGTVQDFLNVLPAVLYEYVLYDDAKSEFLYMSPASKDILSHPASYFMKSTENFWSMVHPDDVSKLASDDICANKKNDYFTSEIRIVLKNGSIRWIQMSSKPTSKRKRNSVVWSGYIIDITERKETEEKINSLVNSLKKAKNEISVLQGFIPICSYCNSIRDLDGAWDKMESYIAKHSSASFSHGICPSCLIQKKAEVAIDNVKP